MQVKEEDGNYICLKHNQMIQLIVMDKGMQPADQMLCQMCMRLNRQPLNQVVDIEQAKEIIREKLIQKTAGQEEKIHQQLQKLRILQQNMIELRQQLLMNIENINRTIEQWINELNKSIKNDSIDLIKGLYLLQQDQVKIEQNNTYMIKLYSAFKRLLNIDGIQKCYSDLKNIIDTNVQQNNQRQQSNQYQEDKQGLSPINYKLINQVKQKECCFAMAFNSQGSIMVAGSSEDIKIWKFDQGNMTQLNVLKGQGYSWITCLLFSKKNQWFISGNGDGIIKSWKQGKDNSEWLSNYAEKKHSLSITCIILTNNEDQLLSCSIMDKKIIVWSVRYESNQIKYQYSLEKKHNDQIFGLSLNQSETALVSWSNDKQLILWTKGLNSKWIYTNSVTLSNYPLRVCFVGENQLLVQQTGIGFTNVYEIEFYQLKEQENLKITLIVPKENNENIFFPTIYNNNKEIIIQKSYENVYVIRKQTNGSFKVEGQPVNCETRGNYGNLTQDGEHLVIWNDKTKEFRIYKISYGQ